MNTVNHSPTQFGQVSSKLLRHLSVPVKERLADVFVFSTAVTFCVPTIVRMRSTGYYDDTIPIVANALDSSPSIAGALSSAFAATPQPGIPATEFGLPGLSLLISILNNFQILGNLSLNLISALLLGTFAALVRRVLRLLGLSVTISLPLALTIALNPANSEFTYFFVATQHLWTITLLLALALLSHDLLRINAKDHKKRLTSYALATTSLSAAAPLISREVFIVVGVLASIWMVTQKPSPNYPLVVVAWLSSLPFHLLQMSVGRSGSRLNGVLGFRNLSKVLPNHWQTNLIESSLHLWLILLLISIFAQLMTLKLVFQGKFHSTAPYYTSTFFSHTIWYACAVGVLVSGSGSLRTLVVGALPGSSPAINAQLDEQFSRWLTLRPGSVVLYSIFLGIFLLLTLGLKDGSKQILALVNLTCIFIVLSSIDEADNSDALARYVVYLTPLILLFAKHLFGSLPNGRFHRSFVVLGLWLILGIQAPAFVDTSRSTVADRSSAIQLVTSGCSYYPTDLDVALTTEFYRIRAKTLANDRWISSGVRKDLVRLSRSPRIHLVCRIWEARSEGDWKTTLDLMGQFVSGTEQGRLDLTKQSIESGSIPNRRIDNLLEKQMRLFLGLHDSLPT